MRVFGEAEAQGPPHDGQAVLEQAREEGVVVALGRRCAVVARGHVGILEQHLLQQVADGLRAYRGDHLAQFGDHRVLVPLAGRNEGIRRKVLARQNLPAVDDHLGSVLVKLHVAPDLEVVAVAEVDVPVPDHAAHLGLGIAAPKQVERALVALLHLAKLRNTDHVLGDPLAHLGHGLRRQDGHHSPSSSNVGRHDPSIPGPA
ncbi:hypothetical protein D3C87_1576780 [compost metagenome]